MRISSATALTCLGLAIGSCTASSATAKGEAAAVRGLTGARTKVVWVQHDGKDPFALGRSLSLMGFDTDDPRGERPILAEKNSYIKPMITPRGTRVVFTRRLAAQQAPEVFIVNWDGTGLRSLGPGWALTTWSNPVDGAEWLYIGSDATPVPASNQEFQIRSVSRMAIDKPGAREVVWNKTLVAGDTFQVSADGRHAAGLFPWPDAGIAELPNGALRKVGEGCWTAMSSPRGPLMWYFDGAHRNLTLVDMRSDKRWTVNINRVPGFGNDEVYHPRWTNHARFLTMSGPYNLGGANQVRTGGTQSEVYIGRFSADYARVESWARVSRNSGGDSYPDVWIDRDRSPHKAAPAGALGGAPADAAGRGSGSPKGAARVIVEARLVKAGAVPTPQAIAPYKHALVVNTYEVLKVVSGAYSGKTILVAQWAIRDRRVLPGSARKPGTTYRLTVDPFDAHPELEGERLVTGSDTPNQPMFYDVEPPK